MKNNIISALAGALCMFLIILALSNHPSKQELKSTEYVHVDFISALQGECFLCGENSSSITAPYWGEDNVGIINLNTFELMRLEINRYDDHGQFLEDTADYMQSSHLSSGNTYVHAYTHPGNRYAHAQISGLQYSIDRTAIQSNLCQSCLDTINDFPFSGDTPAEFAIISFTDRTIRPLVSCYTWFSVGNYGIDCDFEENGAIDLLIHYCHK